MALTNAQTQAFFENANQMGVPNATRAHLETEGVTAVDDLLEFDKETIEQIAANCRRPPGGAVALTFGAKSIKRLAVACDFVRFCEMIGRNMTAANIMWTPVMKNFEIQWKSLMEKKKADEPETPKVTGTTVMKWNESFVNVLHHCIGARKMCH